MCGYRSKHCRKCAKVGHRNHNWKGGRSLSTSGYVRVKAKHHPRADRQGQIYEHTLVMEKKLHRYLLPNENVHHINGIKIDNRPENLELWTVNQPAGQRVTDLVKWAKEILDRYEYAMAN